MRRKLAFCTILVALTAFTTSALIGRSAGLTQPPPPVRCVTCFDPIPATLTVSDGLGDHTATWNGSLRIWITPQICGGQAMYAYGIGCYGAGTMMINRYWYELPSGNYAPCGSVLWGRQAYSSSGVISVTCGSIGWSGSLTKAIGDLDDPIGGDVGFNQ